LRFERSATILEAYLGGVVKVANLGSQWRGRQGVLACEYEAVRKAETRVYKSMADMERREGGRRGGGRPLIIKIKNE